ncbi:MAG: ATP-binding protein [Myxococcota bacterium]
MERFFNTAGPVDPEHHYVLDPLHRWNLKQVLALIAQKKYFLLHAPRQTGKTTCMYALRDHINARGELRCVYINVETSQAAGEDVLAGMQAILSGMGIEASQQLEDPFVDQNWQNVLEKHGPLKALHVILSMWCKHSGKPIVVLIDEIDALVGKTLISVLRQLRTGYPGRLKNLFPHNVLLCGLRDVRDWRMRPQERREFQEMTTGGSPFNIKSNSLRLGDFTQQDIATLYQQHTDDTGQMFESGVVDQVFDCTQGQPWLVNALAYEACFGIEGLVDADKTIMVNDMQQAKEALIQRRETHIDQLLDKLKEPRVYRVIGSIVSGEDIGMTPEDVEYAMDLGLVCKDETNTLVIANPIYREVIPRTLATIWETRLSTTRPTPVEVGQPLDMNELLSAFQRFFRQHSESWLDQFQYKEAGPQLLLQAFLQRTVNSRGSIQREQAVGSGRTDLIVTWPLQDQKQIIVLELKLVHKHDGIDSKISNGLEQTAGYMQRFHTSEGHLLIFDRRTGKSWDDRIWVKQESHNDKSITVWGL